MADEKKGFDINELVKSVMQNIKIEDIASTVAQTQLPQAGAGYESDSFTNEQNYENELSQNDNEEEDEDAIELYNYIHSSYSEEELYTQEQLAILRPLDAVFKNLNNVEFERHEADNFVLTINRIDEDTVAIDLLRKDVLARLHAIIFLDSDDELVKHVKLFFDTLNWHLEFEEMNTVEAEELLRLFLTAVSGE